MSTLERSLPPEWRARLRAERRQARQAADVFARVCREGDANQLYDAHKMLNECVDAWRVAMAKVAKLPRVSPEIQNAFLAIWIESKMLPLRVGNRRVLADALRVLMPGNHSGAPLLLYRGANTHERRRRIYGFSWTTDIATARMFAEHWSQPMPANLDTGFQGVVLRTLAPCDAVLLIRQPEDYYDEGEVVVDPFGLGEIEVVERLSIAPAKVVSLRGRRR
jgi:hypothetical protein